MRTLWISRNFHRLKEAGRRIALALVLFLFAIWAVLLVVEAQRLRGRGGVLASPGFVQRDGVY